MKTLAVLRISWLVAIVAAVLCIAFRLMPNEMRIYNLTPVGAMFLFVGARLPWKSGWLFPIGVYALTDLYLLLVNGWSAVAVVYLCLSIYLFVGRGIISSSNNPLRLIAAALVGSTCFFLLTNFAAWLDHALEYPLTISGLIAAMNAGLPFHRGILLGDLCFSGVFFGSAAALVWLQHRNRLPANSTNLSMSEEVR